MRGLIWDTRPIYLRWERRGEKERKPADQAGLEPTTSPVSATEACALPLSHNHCPTYRLRSFPGRLDLGSVVLVVRVGKVDVAVGVEVVDVHPRFVVLVFLFRRLDDQDVADLQRRQN